MDDLGTGWKHQRAGQLSDAEKCYRRFLDSHPNHAEGWAALGVVAFKRQDLDEAIACYVRSLALKPGSAEVLTNLGVAYAVKRDFDAAERTLRQATAIRPPFVEAYRNLGHALRDQGKLGEAARAYQQARMLSPDDLDILGNLGSVLHKANRGAEGIELLTAAVRLAPRAIKLQQLLGFSLMAARRFDEAEAAFRHALELDRTDANSYSGLGVVQTEAGRFDAAEASCREAIRLKPDHPEAHQNLGNVFFAQNRYDDALAWYAAAIRLRPDLPDVHNNVGVALGRLGRHEESILAYDRALACNPKHLDARKNRAITKLSLGHYLEGFPEYEARWAFSDALRLDFTQPVWNGESLTGKTILLVAEQGLGDTIQFVRFAPKVKAMGGTVVFRCFRPLVKLFANFPGIDVLISDREPLPSFDVYAPLVSLAAIFRTTLEDVPRIHPVPYLEADPNLVERWRDRLGPRAAGELRVGIFWQGNPTYPGDRFRSAPLEAFLPLAAVPGVKLISFQKGHGVEQIAPLADRLPLLDFGDELDRDSGPFQDTAALMSLLDLMVTINSAPVHLAGALGVPTWLALSTDTDWRWLAGREDSPWYPTVRVFRQSEVHQWNDVFQRMADALKRDFAAAEPSVRQAPAVQRDHHRHQLLGLRLAAAKRFDEAEAAFRRALALVPNDAASHNALGIIQAQLHRFADAEASSREAIRLNPNFVEAHQNLGDVLRELDRYDEALASYATAIQLRPDSVGAYNNLGVTLGRIGRHEDAIRAYDHVLALDPQHPEARKNRAVMKLVLGDYLEGFAEFDAIWRALDVARLHLSEPLWKGEPISGKTILLIAEQGLGDTIQFIRFASKVKGTGATVIFRCYNSLLKLLERVAGVDALIPEDEPLPKFDVYLPLMSLPAIFRTTLEDIPGIHPVPYLEADPARVERWHDRLGVRAPGELRVGICWQGNPANSHDRFRSIPLAAFLPLAAIPGVKLISLQRHHGLEQIDLLADRLPLLDLRESTQFEETAALLSVLDLTITIDSALVHLAGALGVPTWLALSINTDWRWLAGREDSPWYPTVRVFQQSKLHNWDEVFERIAGALAELAASPRGGSSSKPRADQPAIAGPA